MTILKRIERRWAQFVLADIREHYARVEAGLRLRLHRSERLNRELDMSLVQMLNSHMDLCKDIDELDVISKRRKIHADNLARALAEGCDQREMGVECCDCASYRCPAFVYYSDHDV